MRISPGEYTLDSFIQYLQENQEAVFEEEEARKWLNIHIILHNMDEWRSQLFAESELTSYGDVGEVSLHRERGASQTTDERFYVHEYVPGMLLFFSSAIREDYQQTLQRRVKSRRGVTEAWIPPEAFHRVREQILERHGGYIYRFMSRRGALDETPAQIRPGYKRRFNYTGDDGTQVLRELQDLYGVLPQSIYVQVHPELKIQVKNSGFFSAQEISSRAIEIFFEMLDEVQAELLRNKETTEQLEYRVHGLSSRAGSPQVASVTAGQIELQGNPLTAGVVQDFVKTMDDFSFLDRNLVEGSLGFSATVVDELKGSVFNVSMSEDEIDLIPKYETTFESFLSFYRGVTEQLDDQASLRVWSAE